MIKAPDNFKHPLDTPLSAALRFVVELVAWVSGPWAASTISAWLLLPALLILLVLPAVFSTPHDKRMIVIATPGPIRLCIELLLFVIAALAPWYVWSGLIATLADLVVLVAVLSGWARFKWLAEGARINPS